MKNKIIIVIYLSVALNFHYLLCQQEEQKPSPGSSSKPLELPNFIIQGREQLNIKSGTKQYPDKPDVMTQEQLDSLNSLEKQQSLLLNPESLPENVMESNYKRGYVTASVGSYLMSDIEAGYGVEYNEYSLFGNAGLNYSNGHIPNSEYGRYYLNLFNDYIAPEKYFVFGGSKTRTSMKIKSTNYELYSEKIPPARNLLNFDLRIDSDGSYSGFVFSTGAQFHSLQISQDNFDSSGIKSFNSKAFDNLINGYVIVKNMGSDYELGGKLKLDLESLRGNGTHFIEASGFGTYKMGKVSINLEAGFQSGSTSNEIERAGLLVSADVDYRMSNLFTLKTGVFSGLKKVSFINFLDINPYMNIFSNIDYVYEMPSIKAFLYYHPDENKAISAGIKFGTSGRAPLFDTSFAGSFNLNYEKVNKLEIISEGFWNITNIDLITFNGTINYTTLSGTGNFAPYYPILKLSVDYGRKWMENKFGTNFGLIYIGNRYADFENKTDLSGYMDVRLKADYLVREEMTAYLEIRNLFNSDIVIWNAYKERGIFLALGINYRF